MADFQVGDVVRVKLARGYDTNTHRIYDDIVGTVEQLTASGRIRYVRVTYHPQPDSTYKTGDRSDLSHEHWVLASKLSTFKLSEDVKL